MKKLFENRIFKFISSVKLALPMILLISLMLATGTIVEAHYSTAVAKRYVYGTWWFNLALLLLGVNVFCSAIARYPWKKHQTGFVITHLGILIILAGSLVTQQYGLDGQIALNEGEEGHVFQESAPTFYYQIGRDVIHQRSAGFNLIKPTPDRPLMIHLPNDVLIMINDFYVNAAEKIRGRAANPGEKGYPAIHLALNSSFVNEDQWLFLGNKEESHLDLGPASIFFEKESDWRKQLAQGTLRVASNALVVLLASNGNLKYQTRHDDQWTLIDPLQAGEAMATGWMDMQFQVLECLPDAIPDETYQPIPFGYQQDLAPAIHYEVMDRTDHQEGWLGYQTEKSFSLAGETVALAYGPRQIQLPFTIHLIKFNLGFDPGTNKPASYASRIDYRDQDHPGVEVPASISMNEPLHHLGYTVYQASYQPLPDGKYTSVFSVGKDPGMWVKYWGAIILVLGIILMFWFKNPREAKDEHE